MTVTNTQLKHQENCPVDEFIEGGTKTGFWATIGILWDTYEPDQPVFCGVFFMAWGDQRYNNRTCFWMLIRCFPAAFVSLFSMAHRQLGFSAQKRTSLRLHVPIDHVEMKREQQQKDPTSFTEGISTLPKWGLPEIRGIPLNHPCQWDFHL